MRGFQPQLAQQFAQKKKRANYAEGGPVRGPGTGTSDSIKDVVSEGTYIMPTDSTQAIGEEQLATMGQEQLPVNLSNGEFKMPPEQVHAVGVQALDQMKDATHTPTPEGMGNPAKGVKPELFFADGGVATTKKKKASDSPSDAGDASGGSGGADASAAPSSPPPSSVPGADGVIREGSSYSAAPAVPAAPTAPAATGALPSALEAASPAVAQKPNYFPGNSPDAGAPIYNGVGTANGLGSSGKLATVPQGLAGDAQPPAPQIPQNMGNRAAANPPQTAAMPDLSAQIPGQNVQAPAFGASPAAAAQQSPAQPLGTQALSDRAAIGSAWDGVKSASQDAGRAILDVASLVPRGAIGAYDSAVVRPMRAAGIDAGYLSPSLVPDGVDPASMTPFTDQRRIQQAQAASAPPPQNASASYNFPNTAGAGRGNVNPPNAFPNAVVPSIAEQTAQNNAKPAAPEPQKATGVEGLPTRDIGGGIMAVTAPGHEGTLYTDNKDPMMAGFMNRAAGGPTKEVQDIMQRMSDKSDAQRANRFQAQDNAVQFARESQQAQAANAAGGANARQVQNRMDQEKYLRQLDVKASSRTGTKQEQAAANLAYTNAKQADAAVRQGTDAGSIANTQAETARYNADTAASTASRREDREDARSNQRNARDDRVQSREDAKFASEEKARGFSVRQAEKAEAARDGYFKALDSGDEKAAATALQKLNALSNGGKEGKDRYITVGGETTVVDGQTIKTAPRVFDTQTREWMDQAGSGKAAPTQAPKAGAIEDGHRFKGGDPSNKKNWEKV